MARYPRGLRNCNPGNIRRSGTVYKGEVLNSTDTAFKQFRDMAHGYRAVFVLLHYYKARYGLNTIRGMINRYAPSVENNTSAYIKAVSDAVGITPDTPVDVLDANTMVPIVCAISKVENGVQANIDDVLAGWNLYRADFKK